MTVKNYLQLPHFFLFKDLYYSHLEAKKFLNASPEDEMFSSPEKIKNLSRHYLVLFEVLEFLHEYTPDFFVINKINDIQEEIVCFANEEFSQTFGLKKSPEGKDIFKVMTKNEELVFTKFVELEIQKAKDKLKKSGENHLEISVKSNNIELPIFQSRRRKKRIYEIHVRLTGVVKEMGEKSVFEGYSIVLGRDTTEAAVQKQIADSFTNIPSVMYKDFYSEAFRRKVLGHNPGTVTLKNVYVLTGFSDISNSANLRLEAQKEDKINKNHEKIKELNKKIESINHELHSLWKEEKKRIEKIHNAIYLLEETDGLDYTLCFPHYSDKKLIKKDFLQLREEELRIMIRITQISKNLELPLKHLVIAHNKKVDFYFEEKFENRFKIATHSVDLFIKKSRLEKAKEKGLNTRITEEGAITVAVDNSEDCCFYKKLFSQLESEKLLSDILVAEVEELPGLAPMKFIRGRVCSE
jgi:hypothetical protein